MIIAGGIYTSERLLGRGPGDDWIFPSGTRQKGGIESLVEAIATGGEKELKTPERHQTRSWADSFLRSCTPLLPRECMGRLASFGPLYGT